MSNFSIDVKVPGAARQIGTADADSK